MITGSVVDTQTVVTLTDTPESVTFPQAGLTVVGIVHNAIYVSIPIDSSRSAFFPKAGGFTTTFPAATVGMMRAVDFAINGTKLNYNIYTKGTSTTVCFYYGTALAGSTPLLSFAAVATIITLSGGAGTGTWTFPSGPLQLTGMTASMQGAAASSVIQVAFNTSPGQVFNAFVLAGIHAMERNNYDIIPTALTVSQQVTLTITLGTGADVVVIYGYYA